MALTVPDPTVERSVAAGAGRSRRLAGSPLVALLIGAAGVAIRAVLLLVDTPQTNSDEATMGLAALHISTSAGLPVWFYGQAYMGTVEAYLAAPLVAVLGTGTAALRLPTLLLYGTFLGLAYRLARALFPAGLAVLTIATLALAADRVVKNQLIAGGGYPEILPAAAALTLLAVWLSRTAPTGPGPIAWSVRRLSGFAAWGLVAGLCCWDDWLVLPYVGAAGALLLWGCWRELRGVAGLVLAGGLLIGAGPLIGYNLAAGAGQDSLTAYAHASGPGTASLGERLHGGVLLGIPLATGVCPPSRCPAPLPAWGVAYLALLVAAVVLAVRAARRAAGAERVAELGRLVLLAGAGLTILAYLATASSGRTPIESARYLDCLLVSTPAVLWPLWRLASRRCATNPDPAAGPSRRWWRWAARVALGAVLLGGVCATGALAAEVPRYQRAAAQQRDLVAALDRAGVTRVYGEYWTCNRITYATGERVICAVLDTSLHPGFDRYLPYRSAVAGAEHPAYVLPAGSDIDAAFVARAAATGIPFTVLEAGGYRVYQPARRVPPA